MPLVTLAEVMKDSGVKEIEDIMSISTEFFPFGKNAKQKTGRKSAAGRRETISLSL